MRSTAPLAAALIVVTAGAVFSATSPNTPAVAPSLRSVAAFESIIDTSARSVALFEEAGAVIQHPRCVNCHPSGKHPTQGDDLHRHQQNINRGEDNLGAIGARCYACHGQKNFDPGKVPGHPLWHLAPIEMAWAGKSLGEICEQIKDSKRNGGKSIDEIVTHMAEDTLVGWAWAPGVGRTPAPGTQQQFGDLIKAWSASGAACPAP